jgi:hypothetical protein
MRFLLKKKNQEINERTGLRSWRDNLDNEKNLVASLPVIRPSPSLKKKLLLLLSSKVAETN